MKRMKPIAYAMMFALLFTATAEAKKKKGKGKGGKANKEKVERAKKREAEKNAVNEVLDEKDTDNNNLLNMTEWLAGESNDGGATQEFIKGDKNRDRHLSRSEIGEMLGF